MVKIIDKKTKGQKGFLVTRRSRKEAWLDFNFSNFDDAKRCYNYLKVEENRL
jgi:hypothetical protein